MSTFYGKKLKLDIFGKSHDSEIGMVLYGIPNGVKFDYDKLLDFLTRRAPGTSEISTSRKEADVPEFVNGVLYGARARVGECDEGKSSDFSSSAGAIFMTTGEPIKAIIKNTDVRSNDYDGIADIPRPGHADYTAKCKYGASYDMRGGAEFSGRMTAPLCIAGGICKQLLSDIGIEINARVSQVGDERENADRMKEIVLENMTVDDSIGGKISCEVTGLPAGLGGAMFDGMEGRISSLIFGIPAIKAIEFGAGFEVARMRGSECNDEFYVSEDAHGVIGGAGSFALNSLDSKESREAGSFDQNDLNSHKNDNYGADVLSHIFTKTNNCGGILGGITNGMPLTFDVAVKPTPSIYRKQASVNLKTGEDVTLQVEGRHDACIAFRAVPCIEAATAIAIYDAYLEAVSG